MIGTSTSTPTTVARAAFDCSPNKEIAVATASSKKLLAAIKHDGAEREKSIFILILIKYPIRAMVRICKTIGIDNAPIKNGMVRILSA
tara:strand:+ start:300 stop:563 length:264 start_codon:yes stop_codon:yes gene_type:complete